MCCRVRANNGVLNSCEDSKICPCSPRQSMTDDMLILDEIDNLLRVVDDHEARRELIQRENVNPVAEVTGKTAHSTSHLPQLSSTAHNIILNAARHDVSASISHSGIATTPKQLGEPAKISPVPHQSVCPNDTHSNTAISDCANKVYRDVWTSTSDCSIAVSDRGVQSTILLMSASCQATVPLSFASAQTETLVFSHSEKDADEYPSRGQASVDGSITTIAHLTNEVNLLRSELGLLRDENRTLSEKVKQKNSKCNDLRQRLAEAAQLNEEITRKYTCFRDETHQVQEKYNALLAAQKKTLEDIDSLRQTAKENTILKDALRLAATNSAELKAELESSKLTIDELETKLSKSQNHLLEYQQLHPETVFCTVATDARELRDYFSKDICLNTDINCINGLVKLIPVTLDYCVGTDEMAACKQKDCSESFTQTEPVLMKSKRICCKLSDEPAESCEACAQVNTLLQTDLQLRDGNGPCPECDKLARKLSDAYSELVDAEHESDALEAERADLIQKLEDSVAGFQDEQSLRLKAEAQCRDARFKLNMTKDIIGQLHERHILVDNKLSDSWLNRAEAADQDIAAHKLEVASLKTSLEVKEAELKKIVGLYSALEERFERLKAALM